MMATKNLIPKCALCRQEIDRITILSCNHKLCEQCFKIRSKAGKIIECPIPHCKILTDVKLVNVRDYKTFTDTLISMNELSVLHSVQEYQAAVDEQEVNIEMQIHNIKKQLTETSETIDKSSMDLDKLYEKRKLKLKEDFETLKDDMIEIGMKRKEQLNSLLSLVNELKNELQRQRKWFGDIVKKHVNSMDVGTLQEDIEDQMSNIDIISVDIPSLDIELVPNEEWTTGVSLSISALDVTAHRQKLKTMTTDTSNLFELSNKTLVKVKEMHLPEEPASVCILNGILYCSCYGKGIIITNTAFTEERCIEAGDMGDIYAVAPLLDSTLVVAADNGLYHISTDGLQIKQVENGNYWRVCSRGTEVCAMSDSGDDARYAMTLYLYNDKQFNKTRSFKLPVTSNLITIGLGHDVIYAANSEENCIYVLSLDGTVLTKHGRRGKVSAGELYSPFAAATDSDVNLLVCDRYNHRIQVLSREGKWRLLQCDEQIKYPRDALAFDGNVFVVGGDPDHYLCVYDTAE